MCCAVLAFLYVIGGFVPYMGIALTVVATIMFLCLPMQQSLCIFLFLHSYTHNRGIKYGVYLLAIFICFVVATLIKYCIGLVKKKYKINNKLFTTLAVFLIFYLIISFFQEKLSNVWFLAYFPLIYLLYEMRGELNIAQAINYLLGGFLSSAVLALIVYLIPHCNYVIFTGGRFRAFSAHQNHVHMKGLFLIAYYIYRFLNKKLSTLKFVFTYLICSVITLACLSKTGILLLAFFTLLLVVLYLKEDFKKKIKYVTVFGIIVLVAAVACHSIIWSILQRFVAGEGSLVSRIFTGRVDIWGDYWTSITENPFVFLFGHGIISVDVYINAQQIIRASHNLFLFMLHKFGLLGCIAIIVAVVYFIRAAGNKKPRFISYLPLIWVILVGMSENVFNYYGVMMIFLSFMVLFMDEKESAENTSTQSQSSQPANPLSPPALPDPTQSADNQLSQPMLPDPSQPADNQP